MKKLTYSVFPYLLWLLPVFVIISCVNDENQRDKLILNCDVVFADFTFRDSLCTLLSKFNTIQEINQFVRQQELEVKEQYNLYDKLGESLGSIGHDSCYAEFKALASLRLSKINDNQESEKYVRGALEYYLDDLYQENKYTAALYMYLGLYLERQGKYEESIAPYERVLDLLNNDTSSSRVPYTQIPLAKAYTRRGEYEKALSLLESALNTYLSYQENGKIVNSQKKRIPKIYNELGIVYRSQSDCLKAIDILDEGLNYLSKLNVSGKYLLDDDAILLIQNKCDCLNLMDRKDESLAILSQTIKEIDESTLLPPYVAGLYRNRALAQKNKSKAKQDLLKALDIEEKYHEAVGRVLKREIGKTYLLLGNLEYDDRNYLLGLESFQKALKSVLPDTDENNYYQNPSSDGFYAENVIVDALTSKAKTFYKIYQKDNNLSILDLSIASYRLAIQVQDSILELYNYESSSLNLANENHSRYGALIKALYDQQKAVGKDNNEEILALIEKSKSYILKSELADKRTLERLENKAIVNELRELRIKKNELKIQLIEAKQKGDSESVLTKQDELDDILSSIRSTVEILKKTSQKYSDIRYSSILLSTKEIQSNYLNSGELMIEYFYEPDNSYVCTIPKSGNSKVFRLDDIDAELENTLSVFLKDLKNPASAIKMDAQKIGTFIKQSSEIYQKILEPVLTKDVYKNHNTLVIIPDGILNYLPFDILISRDQNYQLDLMSADELHLLYSKLDYLIKSKTIEYRHQAATTANDNFNYQNRYAGFAPDYSNCNNWLIVNSSKSCVNSISSLLKGKKFSGSTANKTNFINQDDTKILHFYGHAKADTINANNSSMVFTCSNDPEETWQLFSYEIYGLDLRSDLMVSTACETGEGIYKAGEGVFSLARAFKYAGTKNMIMSLWEGSDEQMKQLTQLFFAEINNEVPYSRALQIAKTKYLGNKSNDIHPFYWASLAFIE